MHPLDQFNLHILPDFAAAAVTEEAQPVNGPPHTEYQATAGLLTLKLLLTRLTLRLLARLTLRLMACLMLQLLARQTFT